MPQVLAKADNLDELNRGFAQQRLSAPVFMNSVPKCGTHLMRNILRMFVPPEQQYHAQFIQHAILRQHLAAYSPTAPRLSWGHLLFSDDAAIALRQVRHLLLVRDPYDWVLARARFFLSDNFKAQLEHLKGGRVSVEEMLNMMIFGIHDRMPALQEIYLHNAVSWMGTKARILRFEDLMQHLKSLDRPEAEAFFRDLLSFCGIELPGDWRERVLVGSDPKQSGTARENLVGVAAEIPRELPEIQKRLVEHAAPGLRALLGYT
jgi:hypothetical protein